MKKISILYIFLIVSIPALAQELPQKDNSEKAVNQRQAEFDIWGKKLSPGECKALYKEIENELKDANYCIEDSDCRTMELGGPLIAFGCFHFVNKNVDTAETHMKMQTYSLRCSGVVDDCSASPLSRCINKKCVMGN